MQTSAIQYWQNRQLIESGSPSALRCRDTAPAVGIAVFVAGIPYPLVGSTITARLRFSVVLLEMLTRGRRSARLSYDSRLRVGDTLIFGLEKTRVVRIDSLTDPGALRVTLERAVDATQGALHDAGAVGSVILITREARVIASQFNHQAFLPWESSEDTARAGFFELEFEIRESSGVRFSVPSPALALTIVENFSGA